MTDIEVILNPTGMRDDLVPKENPTLPYYK